MIAEHKSKADGEKRREKVHGEKRILKEAHGDKTTFFEKDDSVRSSLNSVLVFSPF